MMKKKQILVCMVLVITFSVLLLYSNFASKNDHDEGCQHKRDAVATEKSIEEKGHASEELISRSVSEDDSNRQNVQPTNEIISAAVSIPTNAAIKTIEKTEKLKGGTKEEAEAVEDMNKESEFIKDARDVLVKQNVPVSGRRTSVEHEDGDIIITFHPPEGARAGRFVVRINEETGEVVDTKIWR